MADTGRTIATSVDEYEPSLWHMIGQFTVRTALIALVDQYHNDIIAGRYPDPPVVLLTGKTGMGRRYIAQCIHNAFGNMEFREPASILGTTEDPVAFWKTTTDLTTFYIPHITRLSMPTIGQVIQVIRDGYFNNTNFVGQTEIVSVMNNLIVLSADRDEKVCPDILRWVTLKCDLTPSNNNEQIHEILKQRVKGLHWNASDSTLWLVAQNADNNPGKAMKILQSSYMMSRAENKDDCINVRHAKQAVLLNSSAQGNNCDIGLLA